MPVIEVRDDAPAAEKPAPQPTDAEEPVPQPTDTETPAQDSDPAPAEENETPTEA